MSRPELDSIDQWRAAHWGEPGSCTQCGDPILLADTEDWPEPLCFECWEEKRKA